MGIAAGATANRVGVEAMIEARNEGRGLLPGGAGRPEEGGEGLPGARRRAGRLEETSRWSFESTDTPDTVATPTGDETDDVRSTQGTFSFLPEHLSDEEIEAQIALRARGTTAAIMVEFRRRPASTQQLLGDVAATRSSPPRARPTLRCGT